MRDIKKIERKLRLTNSAAYKILSIANKKDKDTNKIFAAKQMLVYYLDDILEILRKDSYTPDDILLLILKTSMCLNAIRYLFQAALEKDCLNYLNDEEKKVIARFRTLRSITTAHPFDTSRGAPSDFGRDGEAIFCCIIIFLAQTSTPAHNLLSMRLRSSPCKIRHLTPTFSEQVFWKS